jgi:cytochrome c-type biogenesis protein CcmE
MINRNVIIALVLISIGIFTFINASNDYSHYANFKEAQRGDKVKIVGKLSKDKEMVYDAEKDANYFSFYMTDDKGIEKQVVLSQPKPQDFEMSESIVATGKMNGEVFEASELLLKCPSKYKNEEIAIKAQAK